MNMIIHRSMHAEWLSNTYLVADLTHRQAVFIDAGGPITPLAAKVAELNLNVSHVLLTHDHSDHTAHADELSTRYEATIIPSHLSSKGMVIECGELQLRSVSTPGHCLSHVAWVLKDASRGDVIGVFTGDVLFRGTVGGTLNGGPQGFENLKHSIEQVLLTFDNDTLLYPGHMDETTVHDEQTKNPFILAWRGESTLANTEIRAANEPATLFMQAPDYDGGTKAWIRFIDGREAIVGGSLITQQGATL